MKLSGIIETEQKNIGIEIYYNKNIIHFLRKSSHDILLLFDNLYSMKSNILEKINSIYIYDKLIQDIIFNNHIDVEHITINVNIPTLNAKEYLKVFQNVIIITNKFNNGVITLNNQNYKIDILNDDTILLHTNYTNYSYNIKKLNIKIEIKLNKINHNIDFIFFKISNYNPLGNIIIQHKFIHIYYCLSFNLSISFIFNDYYSLKYYEHIELVDYSDDEESNEIEKFIEIKKIQNLLELIKKYIDNDIKVKNINKFNIDNEEQCPLCYCSDSNIYSIKICKNNHNICNICLLKLFKNELDSKCPLCRENIYFENETNNNIVKEINFFKNKLNHINLFMY